MWFAFKYICIACDNWAIRKKQRALDRLHKGWGVVIGYNFPKEMPFLKKAGTDHESVLKLQESINKITNPLHEYQLYKELEQSYDMDDLPFEWPSVREDQHIKVHDYRAKAEFYTCSVRESQTSTIFDQMNINLNNKDRKVLSREIYAQRSTKDLNDGTLNDDEEEDDRLNENKSVYDYSTVLEKSDMAVNLPKGQIATSSNLLDSPSPPKRMRGTILSPVTKMNTFAK